MFTFLDFHTNRLFHYVSFIKDLLDVSNLENFLKKESAKEEVDHLKKLGTDWKNLYFQTDLLIWNDGNGLNGCLDSTFSGDLVNAKVSFSFKKWSLNRTEF